MTRLSGTNLLLEDCVRPRSLRCRGTAMVLVLLAMTVGVTLGLTYLASVTRTTHVAGVIEDHTQARLVADAGLQLSVAYIERVPDGWREREAGTWVDEEDLLGGSITIEADFDAAAAEDALAITNMGFEQDSDSLATPFLFPPMSGTLGGWDVTCSSFLGSVTGLTVPQVSVGPFFGATEGSHAAQVQYTASVKGEVSLSNTLSEAPEPCTQYALSVAVGRVNVLSLLADFELRVWSGGTLLASSADSTLLSLLDLGAGATEYTLRFETGDTVPADPLRIELYSASTLGVLATVFFDDVHLTVERDSPIMLTATATFEGATHQTTAVVVPRSPGSPATILSWNDE